MKQNLIKIGKAILAILAIVSLLLVGKYSPDVRLGGGDVLAETISVFDDKISPTDVQKVEVTTTREVTTTEFSGTLSDIRNEILPKLYVQRTTLNLEIERYEKLALDIENELLKLPARVDVNPLVK